VDLNRSDHAAVRFMVDAALAFIALATPAAQAGEYCSTNSSGMRGCGCSRLEQCKASMAGINGTCDRDPLYKDIKSALAYQPKQTRSRTALHPAKQTVQQ
jgi:hypothetical protein